MGNVKPWQIVLLVVAVVAVATSAYFSMSGEPNIQAKTSVLMFDVNTGDSQEMGFGKGGAAYPGINPKTKTLSMLPIQQREDGKWYLIERYASALKNIEGSKAAVIDQKTGEVRHSNK